MNAPTRHWAAERLCRCRSVSFFPLVEHQAETGAAYDGVVELYASMFADRLETRPFARAMVGGFAELVRGTRNSRVADVGCGPGHLTALLHDLGLDAFGLDLSPAMVEYARRAHPALRLTWRGWRLCRSRTARSAACWPTTR
jgi:SAM-dependent methyltransferase